MGLSGGHVAALLLQHADGAAGATSASGPGVGPRRCTLGASPVSMHDGWLLHMELCEGLTQAPPAPTENPMHGELWITGWQEHEDAIPHDMRPAYFDVDAFSALPHKLQVPHDFGCRLLTKTDGVHYWIGRIGPYGFALALYV